jgi:Putative Actinobacterial Holin-X, holin superfamily III
MAETAAPRPDGQPGSRPGSAGEESLGGLVSLAIKDVSQLIKWEIDLAKLELRGDIKRLAISGAMLAVASFVGCLVLVLASFTAAYGIYAAGMPGGLWASFAVVTGVYVVIALLAIFIAWRKTRRLGGLRRTRATVQESLAILHSGERREGES